MYFNEAELIMDAMGRPIFVLPIDLPEGDCVIDLHNEEIEFKVGNERVGVVPSAMPEMIAWLSVSKQAGIIVYTDESKPCPDALTHVAQLNDVREGL